MSAVSPSVVIRLATRGDIPQLCSLLALLFNHEADFTPNSRNQTQGLELIIEQPLSGRIYCAVIDGNVVGMVSILFSVSTAEGGRVAWLEDMIVHPDMQGHGIGSRLLETAIAGARDSGCLRITLLTDRSNEPAMRFYSRTGFKHSAMTPMRLQL